jgi:hypothetical protein
MIKDILTDIVTHTHNLNLTLAKIIGEDTSTAIESAAEDRSVVMFGKTHNPVNEFDGVFGMPNLDKLALLLKNPEYKENATIQVVCGSGNNSSVPSSLHFENEDGDFINNYRLMSTELINTRLQAIKFKGANWDVQFTPSLISIQRLKLQSQIHSDDDTFQISVDKKDLLVSFGDSSTHSGSFVFQSDIGGKLKSTWSFPVGTVLSILNLDGEITMKISDAGAMMITVDSGIAEYNYILPAHTK